MIRPRPIERTASRSAAVNDSRRAATGVPAVVATACRAVARTRLVEVSQAHISWRTSAGRVERRIGPRDGPASVIVVLFSPIAVSEADQRSG
ncbi:hypothetical protein [Parafrankia sp. FMc2]|uniref:hypothetical protein n=1 Tax=Parafrankia sp. FMc2 TaxID=3233196 RepID=UPI0034D77AF6